MLPFVRMLDYGNIAPNPPDPSTRFKIYSGGSAMYFHDTYTKNLYASAAVSQGTGTGVASSKFILSATNVKRVLLENNSSGCQLYEEDGTGKVFITGSPSAFSGSGAYYNTWTDCTSWITSSGINVSDIKYMSSYSDLKVNLITTDGTLYCCGTNSTSTRSSFGNGTNTNSFNAFVKIEAISSVKKAVGNIYLKEDNTLWGCGINTYYQLGTGNQTASTGVVRIQTNVIDVDVSYQSTFFIKDDNKLYACGTQYGVSYGNEFGTGTTLKQYTTPTLLNSDVQNVHCCVGNMASHIRRFGTTIFATGVNTGGQLGVGNLTNQFYYTQSYANFNSSYSLVLNNIGSLILTDEGKLFYTGFSNLVMGGSSGQYTTRYTEVDMSFIQ
ncbi:hypothetical protein VWH97_05960 [Escherichia coli O157]|nr:hypothetical protein [Escherichia coli O157]